MSACTGWKVVGEDVDWVRLLIIVVGPALWRKGGRTRRCEGTEVGFVVPWYTRCSRSGEVLQIWGLGSRGWLEVEEGGLVGVNGVELATSRCVILLSLPWLDGMIVGECIAKGLDEVVALGDVAGEHVSETVVVRQCVGRCCHRYQEQSGEEVEGSSGIGVLVDNVSESKVANRRCFRLYLCNQTRRSFASVFFED